jgi:hypothetical protein
MNVRPISSWTLYKLRFVIAYSLLAIFAATVLSLNITVVPPGLGPSEQQSVIASAAVSFTEPPTNIVDIPYHALQKLSVEWLGVTPLGVRLPSLVFGALTAICLVLILRRWFRPHVAVAVSFLIVVMAWFLSMTRLGTPVIMIPFWTSFLMLTATYITQETKAWKWWRVVFAFGAAFSLYTPFMTYLFAAVILAGVAQPHLRYLLRESTAVNLTIGGFFFLLLLVPLGWGIYHNPEQIRTLLAIPAELPDLWQYIQNLWVTAVSDLMNPYNTKIGEVITPALGLSMAAIGLIGAARLIRDIHSVRSHFLLIWGAVLLPVVALNPTNLAVLFVPSVLVVAIGLNQIIRYWYRLFPLNPYARIFGLVPLAVLIVSIVQLDYQRYIFGMMYSKEASTTFSRDPFIVQSELARRQDESVAVVVPPDKKAIYEVMAARQTTVRVAVPSQLPTDMPNTWILADDVRGQVKTKQLGTFNKLLVIDTSENARRFWVYQR